MHHLSALRKQQILAAGKLLCFQSADEGPDRQFARGWNCYVSGDDIPEDVCSQEFIEGYNKAAHEYQGRTMRSVSENTDAE